MDRIRLKEKVGYGLGDAASSMFWKILGMYALFFYTDVMGLTAMAAGVMFMVARCWDFFLDLGVGVMADRTRSRWGRYRPYLLWISIPFMVMATLMFFVPDLRYTGKVVYSYITYSLMMLVYSLINVPYASLLGVISPDSHERSVLSSYRMAFAFLGSFFTFMLLQPMIDFFSRVLPGQWSGGGGNLATAPGHGLSTRPEAWTLAVACIGVICTIFFMFCFRWTRERIVAGPAGRDNKEGRGVIKSDLLALFKNTPWRVLILSGLAALLFNALRDSVAIYYFKDYVQSGYVVGGFNWHLTTVYFLSGQAANLLGVIIAPKLSQRYGKKRTYIMAMSLAGFFSILFYFVPLNIAWILCLQCIISLCAGYVFPLLWSMFADIVDFHEYATGRRISGMIFSSSSMSQKIGWTLGTAMTGWLLFFSGYDKLMTKQGLQTIQMEKVLISVLPALCCLISLVIMSFYSLTDKKVNDIAAELVRRQR